MSINPSPKIHYRSLDGFRACAILIVLVAHAGFPYPRSGSVGVEIFFVLSGFLITSILSRDYSAHGRIHFINFYARRFLRLVPCLMSACLLHVILSLVLSGNVRLLPILYAITYSANWAMAVWGADMGALSHCWSLAIEEQYYLFWPMLIAILERFLKRDLSKGWALSAFAALLAIYRYCMVDHYDALRIYVGTDTNMDGLVLGSSLSYFARECGGGRPGKMRMAMPVLSYLLVPLSLMGLLLIMYLYTWGYAIMGKVGFALVSGASAVLVADLVVSPRSFLRRWLELPILTYIGRISYGLYLYHYPIFKFIDEYYPDRVAAGSLLAKFAACFIVASLSYRYLEKPFLTLKENFVAPDRVGPNVDERVI